MTPTGREAPPQLRMYRALSSPVRTRLLELLRREPGLHTAALSDRLELHVNTVRSHLAVLEEAGLVEPITEERHRPGRPRLLYRAVPDAASAPGGAGDQGYRFLAAILASYLAATTDDPASSAEQAGRGWGSFVVDKPAPFTQLEPAEAIERLTAMLDEFGFEPEVEAGDGDLGPRVVLRRCPFLEVAREHQDVVCSIHLGLMRGALDELGVDIEVDDLIPWAEPDRCISHLRIGRRAG